MSTTLNFEVISRKAQQDDVLRDMLHVLEDRQRTLRDGELSIRGFTNRARREGFEHAERDYAQRIKFLADAGLGTLDKTNNGKVLGLKHVAVDIKSFARAVLEKDDAKIKEAHKRNRYTKFPVENVTVETAASKIPAPIELTDAPKNPAPAPSPSPAMDIQMSLKGKTITVRIPEGAGPGTLNEVMSVLAQLA